MYNIMHLLQAQVANFVHTTRHSGPAKYAKILRFLGVLGRFWPPAPSIQNSTHRYKNRVIGQSISRVSNGISNF